MARQTDHETRFTLWEQQTRFLLREGPPIRYGDLQGLRALRKPVRRSSEKTERPRLSNVWLER